MNSLKMALKEIRGWGLYKTLTAVAALVAIGFTLLTVFTDVPSPLARSNDDRDIEEDNTAVNGGGAVGGLVGRMKGGTIENSTATGTVTSNNPDASVGGLVGEMEGGTIIDSEADVDIRDTSGNQEPAPSTSKP